MKQVRKSEKGQVLILITAAIITLLGFAALAIDGGRAYSEKRTIQGVADTTSMTAALYLSRNGDAVTAQVKADAVSAALTRAANNGYSSQVTVNITEDSTYYYVETNITSEVDPIIAQVVYNGDLDVAAKAVARVLKTVNFALGMAIYAADPAACGAINQSGTADVTIVDNGMFSNSSCGPDPSQCNTTNNAIAITGSGSYTGDLLTSAGGICASDPDQVDVGTVTNNAPQQTLPTLTPPNCDGLSNLNDSNSSLVPGIYNGGIKIVGGQDVTLDPGLYCLDDDLEIQNGSLTGLGVTIYLMGNATVKINGGDIHLTPPLGDQWADGAGNYWNGMLMFQDYGNTSELTINGNLDSYLEGTILAPDANCKSNGAGEATSLDSQVICNTIDLLGTAALNLAFNEGTKYDPPMIVDLFE